MNIANAIAVDNNGNVYTTGVYSAGTNFGNGIVQTTGGNDIFVLKYDTNGNFIWVKTYGGSGSGATRTAEEGKAIQVNGAGTEIYVTGSFTGLANGSGVISFGTAQQFANPFQNNDIFVLKLDASGNTAWAGTIGNNGGESVTGLALSPDASSVYLTGGFVGTVDFDISTGGVANTNNSAANQVCFILKLNSSGVYQWAKAAATTTGFVSAPLGNALVATNTDVYAGGHFRNTMDFNPGPGAPLTSAGQSDIFIWKLDASGNFGWAKRIGGATGDDVGGISLDPSGNIYLTGSFSGTVDFDPDPVTSTTLAAAGTSNDAYALKLSPIGTFVGVVKIGGSGFDYGNGIVPKSTTEAVVVGAVTGGVPITFSPTNTTTAAADRDAFYASYTFADPPLPTLITGQPASASTVCSGRAVSISVQAIGAALTYQWYRGNPGDTSTPLGGETSATLSLTNVQEEDEGTYFVRVTGNSGTVDSNGFTLTVEAAPAVMLSPNGQLTCSVLEVTLSASGANSYTFTGPGMVNQANNVATVNQPGTYSVTATSVNGCTAVQTTIVQSDTAIPTITLGNNGTLTCSVTQVTLSASGANSYTFTGPGIVSQANNVAYVNLPGTYTVVASGANGCTATQTTTVQSDTSTPVITLGNSGTLTCSVAQVTLSASGANSYTFTGPSVVSQANNVAYVDQPGTYTVVASGANGCTATQTTTVQSDTSTPAITLGNSGTLTCSVSQITVSASGANSYTFTGPGIVSQANNAAYVNLPGTYTVVASGANGCTATQTTTVYSDTSTPAVTLGNNGTLTCSVTQVTLSASGANSYTFTGPSVVSQANNVAMVNQPGTYTVTASNPNGCTASQTTTVYSDTSTPAITLGNNGTLTCSVAQVTLSASGANSYTFTGPSVVSQANNVAYVDQPGTYTVVASGANGCTATQTTTVQSDTATPIITLGNNGTLTCSVAQVTLSASGANSYTFTGPSVVSQANNVAYVDQPGTYTVVASGANGCTATQTTTVQSDTSTPAITLGNNGTLTCSVAQVTLSASGANSYTFTGPGVVNQSSNIATVNQPGTYTVVATGANGCTAVQTTTVQSETTVPTVTLTANSTLSCAQTSVTLTASGATSYTFAGPGVLSQAGNQALVSVAGTYTVTASGVNGCTATQTTIVESDTAVPTVTLTSSGTLSCAQTSVTLTAGGGVIYNFNGPGVISRSGNQAVVNVGGTYSVTATSANGCTAIQTTNVQSDTTLPTVTLAASGTLSCAQASVTLTAVGGATYVFGGPGVISQLGNQAVVNVGGTYSVTATSANGCTATQTTSVQSDTSVPAVTLAVSGSLNCTQTSVVLTATPGFVSYAFSAGTGQPGWPSSNTAVVSSSGLFTVTVTAGNGCLGTASVQVIQDNSAPVVTINPNSATLTCSTTSVSLSAVGSGTYQWNTGDASQAISVTAAGVYSVTLTGSNGCTGFASATVSQDVSVPTVSISPSSATLTCAASSVSLSAVGSGTYLWNTGATTASISATTAGNYSVTLTGANGCSATALAQVVQDNTVPTVSISPTSATLSCTTTSVSLTAIGTGTYRWNTGATTQIISATAADTYSVTLTGSNGCTATANAQVTQDNSVPTVSISPTSATLSCTTTSVSLSAVGSGTYLWNTGATTSVISATAGGTYSVTLTAGNGCKATAFAQVVQDNSVPTVSISPASATLNCTTSSVSLSATGAGTYLWNTGATTSVISATAAGTYSVTLTAGNGCTATALAQVIQDNTVPTVSISPSSATLSCTTTSVSLSAVGAGTYLWNTGATTQVISATTAGNYSVTLTAANGCKAIAYAQVVQDNTVPTVSVSPSSATLSCTTTSVSLSALGSGTYLWNTGATSSVISVTSAGNYSVTLTAGNGCKATASATVIQDSSVPTVSISPASATLSCSITSVNLSAVGTGTYLWNTGSTSQVISATAAGTYTVTLTAGNGCTATATAQVVQDNSLPTVSIAATPSLTIATGQSATLTASGATTYQWNNSANTPAIVVNAPGVYSVTGTTGNCQGVASVTVVQTNAPSGPFAITSVTTNNCQQIAANRYVINFTPVYAGLNGQPVSVSVVNEMFPTTAPAPYTLQLYTDNPVIILKAQQTGTPGEATFNYNWLAACSNPMPNTPPRVNQPLANQIAKVGEAFGYTIPQLTFTDNETPNSLALNVTGLPAGMNFTQPNQIGGVPAMVGVSLVTVTATDPQGLAVSTTFSLSVVQPSGMNTPPTVANPVANQVATQGQPFSLNVSAVFTDAETPNALLLNSSLLPAGLTLAGGVISGTPSQTGTTNITLTATDPGGLSATAGFTLTVQPVPSGGSFAITSVTTNNCQQISANRYAISFTPVYSGTNGQPISFSVVNELFPTTDPGPYSLQLYTDNPVIILKAQQGGTPGEVSYSYNWLATCGNPMPNTAPRVNQPLMNQVAVVGQGFGYTIPQLTFTDNETPNSLVLTVTGLPAGLNFTQPTQIGGVPTATGVSTVTVTATDPQGLAVSTTFLLTVNPAGTPNGFAITGVQTVSCVTLSADRRSITFTPQYSGTDGSPISFSVVNEMLPTTNPGPYTLPLYTDNPTIQLRAQQGGAQASYAYNWLAACSTPARQGLAEAGHNLEVRVLGNPVEGPTVDVEVRGVAGERLQLQLVTTQGNPVTQKVVESAREIETVQMPVPSEGGVYILKVSTSQKNSVVKVLRR
ncbi:hypothetical protein GCM10027592_27330 [Spirosoma flavus]